MEEIQDYQQFVGQLKAEIRRSQYLSFRSTNSIMIELYWSIGKQIAEKQKELGWGNDVIKQLSIDLQKEFEGKYSFSLDNLHRMKQLYSEYSEKEVLGHAVPKLSSILGHAVPKLQSILGHAVPKIQSILGHAVPEITLKNNNKVLVCSGVLHGY